MHTRLRTLLLMRLYLWLAEGMLVLARLGLDLRLAGPRTILVLLRTSGRLSKAALSCWRHSRRDEGRTAGKRF